MFRTKPCFNAGPLPFRQNRKLDTELGHPRPRPLQTSAQIIKNHETDWTTCMRLQPRRTYEVRQARSIFGQSASPTPQHFLKPFRPVSTVVHQESGMSGTPTLSPTCSLDIRILTPGTSPITRESNATKISQAGAPLTLKEQYHVQTSTNGDYTTFGDKDVKSPVTRKPLPAISRPKLALNIPLATSDVRDLNAGDTTTPPLSPQSESQPSTGGSNVRQDHLKHTLHSLVGNSHRPKLALNIPTRIIPAIRSPDAGDTTTPPLSPQYHPHTARKGNLSPHDEGDFKFTRRSLNSGPRRKPTLLNLPPYIQAIIIHFLASNECLDKYALRATCRRFYAFIGPPRPKFDRYPWGQKGSLLSCKDCLRLRNRAEFVDDMRSGDLRPGGSGARERYCIDCGLKEQFFEGKRIPARLKRRTRLKVDGVEFVVCWYCGEFGRAPRREETHFRDCCRECFVDGSRWMWQLRGGEYERNKIRRGGMGRVLDG
jgi:hypothetical protein